jgi:hopanoid biosynthesis associated protein HpnK
MVAGAAADDAIARARRLPDLRVGLHVVVADGAPVLPPEQIPELVDAGGRLSDRLWRVGLRLFFHAGARRQLEAEIRAQFDAFRETGLALDHVNAHHHMHLHPTVSEIVLRVGEDYGVDAVRLPHEPPLPEAARVGTALFLGPWVRLLRRRLRRAGVRSNDFLYGLHDSGRMGTERVLEIVSRLPEGASEVFFHPGASAGPDPELEALTSPAVAAAVQASVADLIAYADLGDRDH